MGKIKKRYLIFEMLISSPKSRFSFITFFYSYLMVSTWEINLYNTFSLTDGIIESPIKSNRYWFVIGHLLSPQ